MSASVTGRASSPTLTHASGPTTGGPKEPPSFLRSVAGAYSAVNELASSIAAIILALVVGGVVIGLSTGHVTEGLTAYQALWTGAFGSWGDLGLTLIDAAPFALAAYAVAFAFRAGLFNIGAEGQLYAGAIAATSVGVGLHLAGWIVLPLAMLAAAVAGALWALIPGLLKAYRGAHEVITTMMMNYVAMLFLAFCVENNTNGGLGPLQDPKFAQPQSGLVSTTFPVVGVFSTVILLAVLCAGIFYFLLNRTTFGYSVKSVGFNAKAARYGGIKVNRTIVSVMLVAGAFAGLAGCSEIFTYARYLNANLDGFTLGFYAIAVALLGRNTAVGALLAAVLFGAFNQGTTTMQFAGIDENVVGMIEGLIVFFVGADALVRYMSNRAVGLGRLGRNPPEADIQPEIAPV